MKTKIENTLRFLPLVFLTLQAPALSFAQVNIKDGSFEKSFDQDIIRHYHSRSLYNGYFGFGWCSEPETSLDTSRDQFLTLNDCRLGNKITFDKIHRNVFISAALPNERIISKNGIYTRYVGDKSEQRFDSSGKLTSLSSPQGKSRILAYNRLGKLSAITDPAGQIYIVTMDRFNQKIIEISSSIKNRYKYIYFGDDLLEVQHSGKVLYRYDYDKLHNLTQITETKGEKKTIETLRYNPEKDLVLEYNDSKSCQEFYQYRPSDTDPSNHYFAEAQRFCPNEQVKSVSYEFIHKIHREGFKYLDKVVISSKVADKKLNKMEINYHAYSGTPLNTQTRRIANDEK